MSQGLFRGRSSAALPPSPPPWAWLHASLHPSLAFYSRPEGPAWQGSLWIRRPPSAGLTCLLGGCSGPHDGTSQPAAGSLCRSSPGPRDSLPTNPQILLPPVPLHCAADRSVRGVCLTGCWYRLPLLSGSRENLLSWGAQAWLLVSPTPSPSTL